jgi:chromosome segregation protein
MKLKKIDLCGFKSFPEPTELLFHDGVTAIVGPNGCGKSNIIDAIRWVMGETSAKGLRGGSMGDVIFSGSESRKPLNFAEVTLTLSEVEGHLPEKFGNYHELAITRRLHRSGESEYLINKVACRLKDITELFMDTGVGRRAYSIVEQGRIDAILSAKPVDRRFLIEEAAGITKYRARKDEALRRMEHTSQNLQRLGDVIGEVRREMNSLKRQASRAEAYKALRAEKRALERDLLVAAWADLQEQAAGARTRLQDQGEGAVAARAEADRIRAGLERGRLAVLDQERALETSQRGVYHLKDQITQRQSRCEFLEHDAASQAERAERATREAAELDQRRASLAREQEGLGVELQTVRERLERQAGEAEELQRQYQAAQEDQRAAEALQDQQKRGLMAVLSDLTRINHGLDHAVRQEADAARRLEGMGRQEAELAGQLEGVAAEIARRATELADAEQSRSRAVGAREAADQALQQARVRRKEAAAAAEEARKALHTDQSRLRGLEQLKDSLEGYGAGVKSILADARDGGAAGVHGVVADTIAAPGEYETALEAALGERLQYVIVEDPARGRQAVEHLKSQRAGRSSFAPLSLRPAPAAVFPSREPPWARGPLLELVEVSPAYRPLAECLLGDVFVVETLDHALSLWQQNGIRTTLVTLDGEVVSAAGVISGGADRRDGAGLLRKNREIRELRAQVGARQVQLDAAEETLAAADGALAGAEGKVESAREEVHRSELQAVHIAKDLDQARERRERLGERREAMEFERDDLTLARDRLREEAQCLERERGQLLATQEAIEGQVAAAEQALQASRERCVSVHAELTGRQVAEAADLQQRHGLAERIRTLQESLENIAQRVERLQAEAAECLELQGKRAAERAQLVRETEVLLAELERDETALAGLAQGLDARRGSLSEEEQAAASTRRAADEAQRLLNEAELQVRELGLKEENLRERCRERLGLEIEEEARDALPEAFDPVAVEAQIRGLADRLEGFGEINLLAIDEFQQRKERFAFLEGQKQDLESSLASLHQAILRINRVSRDRFGETFEKVSEIFEALYPRLFHGGEARLLLTDPEDLLETGIDIVARPPGKKPQHISLLSGGEKALTAVALIFSIFTVKPSPFCILDEVDAPLDEANIGRFSEIVRTMSATSQFLLITHNKATMETADYLYGVTMGSPGSSKVVSVQLGPHPVPAQAA